jgi:mannose/fructose/N-acetylgalactosamine-specific phosphotransferase system component IIC
MKIIKKKIIWAWLGAVIGFALFIVNMFQNFNSTTSTAFALGLAAASLARLVKLYRISLNPQQLKKYEIEQKEKRYTLIAEKSARFAFVFTMIVELVAIFVLLLFGKDTIATMISSIVCIQILVYLTMYYYLCRKY